MTTGSKEKKQPMSFIKGVSITFLTRVYAFITGTIAGMIFARSLGPEAVGITGVIAVIVAVTLQLGNLGIQTSVIYYGADQKIKTNELIGNVLFLGVFISIILTGTLTSIAIFNPKLLLDDIPPLFLYIVIPIIPLTLIVDFLRSGFMSQQKFGLYNLIDIAGYTLNLIGAIVILLVLKLGLLEMMLFGIFTNIPLALFGIIYFHKNYGIHFSANWNIIKKILSYGFKFFICNICGYLVIRSDVFLINKILTKTDTGIYQAVSSYADTIMGVASIVGAILLPKLTAEKDLDIRRENSLRTLRVTSSSLFLMLIIFAILTKPIIWIMYGPEFLSAQTSLLIILPGIFLLSLEVIQIMYLIAGYLPNIIPIMWIYGAVLNISINKLLIPKIGIAGAAISSTLTYSLIFGLVTYLYKKRTNASLHEMFIIKKEEINLIKEKTMHFINIYILRKKPFPPLKP